MDNIPVKMLPSNQRVTQLEHIFKEIFKIVPEFYVRVPGRVNLIGEHIDYSGYGVCPMAIEQDILLAVSINSDKTLNLFNVNSKYVDYQVNMDCISIKVEGPPQWYQYFLCGVKGIIENTTTDKIRGMNVVVSGSIPESAGLSSSSALVSAAALAASWAFKVQITKPALSDLCAQCERYIGTQGGGMDQAIAFLASEGRAKFIEFCPLRYKDVTLPSDAVFVIAHSTAELNKAATGDFNSRVVECRLAAQVIANAKGLPWKDVKKLKDIQDLLSVDLNAMCTLVKEILHENPYTKKELVEILCTSSEDLQETSLAPNMFDKDGFKLRQRSLHVFEEALRVEKFIGACQGSSGEDVLHVLGRLMYESHVSLRDLYECSHPLLDKIVSLSENSTLGTRLTGAGWGGCTIALVTPDNVSTYITTLKTEFYGKLGYGEKQCEKLLFITSPKEGACVFLNNN